MMTVQLEFTRARQSEDPYSFQGLKPQEYVLRVGHGAARRASFPWSGRVMEDLELLARKEPDLDAARRLGEELRRFLDALDWGGHEDTLEEAARQGEPLRLVLRSAAAELYSLPWELVVLKHCGRHLADIPGFTLCYEWPREARRPPRAGAAPEGRVLVAWSEAGGGVPEDRHLEALRQASVQGGFDFDLRRDVVPKVSLQSLEEALSASRSVGQPVTVLHVLCHGAALEGSGPGQYGLAWNAPGDRGGKQLVDGASLGAVLAPYADTLRMVVLCACNGGDGGRLASHLGSVARELHRAGIEMVVASRLPMTLLGSVVLTRTLYERLLVDSTSLEAALGAARRRLRVEARGFDWASLQLYAHSDEPGDLRPVVLRPYRGLKAFGPKDQRFFFGRSRLETRLLERVQLASRGQRPRFQVVSGASGAGKSSLVMAGLVPRLRPEQWDWLAVRPGELVCAPAEADGGRAGPLWGLLQRLRRVWTLEPVTAQGEDLHQEVLEEARRLRQARPGHQLLLVVDPLEEVFTQLEGAERQALLRALWALGQAPELGCVVLATVRVDYLERGQQVALDGSTTLAAVMQAEAHRVSVEQMNEAELAEAIEQPARRVGLELEPGLVGRLCGDAGQEPGALALLELALDLLWQDRDGDRLTHRAYDRMEGLAGGLTRLAEQLYDSLGQEERLQTRRLRAELVALGTGPTAPYSRRRVWLEEIRPTEERARLAFDTVLERFVCARLVTRGSDADGPGGVWLEVAHEVLVRRWHRMQRWLDENRRWLLEWRALQDMAESWHRHRGDVGGGRSYLATGERLEYARRIRHEHAGHLTARVSEFLEASEALARRSALLRRGRNAGLAVGVGLFAAHVVFSATSEPVRVVSGQDEIHHQLGMGALAQARGQLEEARGHYERALGLLQMHKVGLPWDPRLDRDLSILYLTLAEVARQQGRCADAEEYQGRLLHLAQGLVDMPPMASFSKCVLANTHPK